MSNTHDPGNAHSRPPIIKKLRRARSGSGSGSGVGVGFCGAVGAEVGTGVGAEVGAGVHVGPAVGVDVGIGAGAGVGAAGLGEPSAGSTAMSAQFQNCSPQPKCPFGPSGPEQLPPNAVHQAAFEPVQYPLDCRTSL